MRLAQFARKDNHGRARHSNCHHIEHQASSIKHEAWSIKNQESSIYNSEVEANWNWDSLTRRRGNLNWVWVSGPRGPLKWPVPRHIWFLHQAYGQSSHNSIPAWSWQRLLRKIGKAKNHWSLASRYFSDGHWTFCASRSPEMPSKSGGLVQSGSRYVEGCWAFPYLKITLFANSVVYFHFQLCV